MFHCSPTSTDTLPYECPWHESIMMTIIRSSCRAAAANADCLLDCFTFILIFISRPAGDDG